MSPRTANFVGFLTCAGLLAFAFFAQFSLHLEPCPLCIFQRVGVFAVGLVFAAAALHDPVGWPRRLYALLVALTALATMGVALRHLYIQSLPAGAVPACGASLDFMLQVFPLSDVLIKVLKGSGECHRIDWRLLGLAMPAWVFIAAFALGGFGVWSNLKRRRPVLRF